MLIRYFSCDVFGKLIVMVLASVNMLNQRGRSLYKLKIQFGIRSRFVFLCLNLIGCQGKAVRT